MYSGGSGLSDFVGFRLSFHALSPLPIVLSKYFNHPHPYIKTATAISDTEASARCMRNACSQPCIQLSIQVLSPSALSPLET